MLFERVESEGLAHYSYIVGDGNEALVIDPRRDCDLYQKMATSAGMRITTVLETHRNEDYVVGSVELSARSGADIFHADGHLDYRYGEAVDDGMRWKVGRFEVEAISTPGHTLGSMSYLLRDSGGEPWIVFTGDDLFAGDLGRVDLMGMERAGEMAGLLYDSIFDRLLPLGDGVIACPAHGVGSVCAASIADRKWTTLGIERKRNPKLQVEGKDEFVEKMAVELEMPPYFKEMERLNMVGAPLLCTVADPLPLSAQEFAEAAGDEFVLDNRTELAFGAAHLSGSLSIWLAGIPSFAGWFLPYDRKIFMVDETGDLDKAVRLLRRLGFDRIGGHLSGGMIAWHTAGMESGTINTANVHDLCRRLDRQEKERAWILDVRGDDELERSGRITGAHQIHVTKLPERIGEVPRDRPIYIFCGSGLRSMMAASILRREGLEDLTVILGGLAGWSSARCPVVR
ncbi:MAG: MBL fold metallo-hydrolase [Methanothrix sp.]|nr:MBL fold metallo-hydrolase [Methanothrix sp.]